MGNEWGIKAIAAVARAPLCHYVQSLGHVFILNFRFAEGLLTQFQVGHTHNHLDQKYGVVGETLRTAGVLQTPVAFKDRIATTRPTGGRQQHVEIITGSLDWQDYYEGLPRLAGHVQNQYMKLAGEEACHVWQLIRRSDCHVEIDNAGFAEVPPAS